MKEDWSKLGGWLAVVYLVVVLIVSSPLIFDAKIYHGNEGAFLATLLLTSPFSLLLFLVLENLREAYTFYTKDESYFLLMGILYVCAIVNAVLIRLIVQRLVKKFVKWKILRE